MFIPNEIPTWVSVLAVLLAPGAGYWVRGLVGKVAAKEIERVLDGKLAQFRIDLVKEINGTYVRVPECKLIHDGTFARIEQILDGMKEIRESIGKLER